MSLEGVPVSGVIADRIARLRGALTKMHLAVGEHFVGLGRLDPLDLVAMAALQRSLSLIRGFTLLVEERNALAAIPLVGMQLDSVKSMYACGLVDDPRSVASHLLAGEPLQLLKSRDGTVIRESYLQEQLSKNMQWFSDVGKATSGYLHLSRAHIAERDEIEALGKPT